MSILSAKNIDVAYSGDISVLKQVNLDVEAEKITVIIGPNGAGKSTLLKTCYGLLKPRRGSIEFEGRNVTGLRTHEFMHLGAAYVPQLRSIFPDLTVRDNLELGCWTIRKDKPRVSRAMAQVFDFFPILRDKIDEKTGCLSGGQQKILEVGRALLTEPRIMFLDEPTATLAPIIAKEIYSFLIRLKEEKKTTIVLVDQHVQQAFNISDHVYVLELGQNSVDGSRDDFEGKLKNVIKDWLAYDDKRPE